MKKNPIKTFLNKNQESNHKIIMIKVGKSSTDNGEPMRRKEPHRQRWGVAKAGQVCAWSTPEPRLPLNLGGSLGISFCLY